MATSIMSAVNAYTVDRKHVVRMVFVSGLMIAGGVWAARTAPTNLIFRWRWLSVAIGLAAIGAGIYMLALYVRLLLSNAPPLEIRPAGLVVRCYWPWTVSIAWASIASVSASGHSVKIQTVNGRQVRIPVSVLRTDDNARLEMEDLLSQIQDSWDRFVNG
jgi:hypothetical membrane protein